ncbi:MAG: 50S ribosomal protein L20 [Bdellovibrionota bacterium]
MARAKGGIKTRRRHKKVLKMTEGFRNSASRSYSKAFEALNRALNYAFRDRKVKKRDFRNLWVQRINAAVRNEGSTYSTFIAGLKAKKVELDRKVLSDIALQDPKSFQTIVQLTK